MQSKNANRKKIIRLKNNSGFYYSTAGEGKNMARHLFTKQKKCEAVFHSYIDSRHPNVGYTLDIS